MTFDKAVQQLRDVTECESADHEAVSEAVRNVARSAPDPTSSYAYNQRDAHAGSFLASLERDPWGTVSGGLRSGS